jgi:hypothetical protein
MNRAEINTVQGQIARSGLQLCVGIPAAMFAIALILRKTLPFLATPITSEANIKLLGYVFIGLAVVDVIVAFIIKRRLISVKNLLARYSFHPASFAKQLAQAYLPVFAICAGPALYGLVFYLLGGDLDTYVLISIICPAAFLLLKPKEEEIERLESEIFALSEHNISSE